MGQEVRRKFKDIFYNQDNAHHEYYICELCQRSERESLQASKIRHLEILGLACNRFKKTIFETLPIIFLKPYIRLIVCLKNFPFGIKPLANNVRVYVVL